MNHVEKESKNRYLILVTVFILFIGLFYVPSYALSSEQSATIQTFIDEICRKSGVPGIAVSVRVGNDVRYFSSGYADREQALSVNEDTLFELASVSKAFTAFGILLLEEQGFLSMNDPIQKYLPWLTLRYNDAPVNMDDLTLNNFLHHTSGLVNGAHYGLLPMGEGADMLLKTVEALIEAELAFAPGERYEYGTMNYDVLGQVIAVVSGQSYEAFMQTEVLTPLGLHETYMYAHDAQSTGRMAKGYSSAFLRSFPMESPKYEGNKPAGYIISCARDMLRWTDIQMGLVDDIPEVHKAVAEKSHRGDMSVPGETGLHYAAGWVVDTHLTYIGHGGNNPNFTTDVKIYPQEQIAMVLLTNSNQTNNALNPSLLDNIKGILDGKLSQQYLPGVYRMIDIICVGITIAGIIVATPFLLLGLYRWKNRRRYPLPKKRVVLSIFWCLITVATIMLGIFAPAFLGANWKSTLEIHLYSLLTSFIALTFASSSVTWFVFARRK